MSELVIMQNQRAVTSSINVANDFGKQHGHVLDVNNEFKAIHHTA